MKITQITIQKSKTFNVTGIAGRTSYEKLSIGMTAEVELGDNYIDAYQKLSLTVDEAIKEEVNLIKSKLLKK